MPDRILIIGNSTIITILKWLCNTGIVCQASVNLLCGWGRLLSQLKLWVAPWRAAAGERPPVCHYYYYLMEVQWHRESHHRVVGRKKNDEAGRCICQNMYMRRGYLVFFMAFFWYENFKRWVTYLGGPGVEAGYLLSKIVSYTTKLLLSSSIETPCFRERKIGEAKLR